MKTSVLTWNTIVIRSGVLQKISFRSVWILSLFALGACGGEDPLPVEPPLGPQVPCLDACTISCTDEQGTVDEECILACATACFTPEEG